jgi:ribosomal protein S13
MTPQEAILKIKGLFESTPEGEVKVQMAEYSLKDGTKVDISSLEVGGDIALKDGKPAPDGEHELVDGTIIVVASGKITEVKGIEEEPSVEVEIEAGKDKDKKIEEMESEFNNKVNALISENEYLKSQISELTSKMKNGFVQIIELVEQMSKAPDADPIEKPSMFKFQSTKDLKFERLSKYRNAILNNKN